MNNLGCFAKHLHSSLIMAFKSESLAEFDLTIVVIFANFLANVLAYYAMLYYTGPVH
jgi:hypothetical protein